MFTTYVIVLSLLVIFIYMLVNPKGFFKFFADIAMYAFIGIGFAGSMLFVLSLFE